MPRTGLEPSLAEIAREWGWIGCIGFGGPPAHIALFSALCVTRREWLSEEQFERAIAATNLLPGPASTQLAIYCAWRLRGPAGALIGGLGFILPGLAMILALSVLFLAGSPPTWVRGAGMGAGAAVAPVAVSAGLGVALPIWRRATDARRLPVVVYALAAATAGPWLVLVLLACGAVELTRRGLLKDGIGALTWPLLAVVGDPVVPLQAREHARADVAARPGHHHRMSCPLPAIVGLAPTATGGPQCDVNSAPLEAPISARSSPSIPAISYAARWRPAPPPSATSVARPSSCSAQPSSSA